MIKKTIICSLSLLLSLLLLNGCSENNSNSNPINDIATNKIKIEDKVTIYDLPEYSGTPYIVLNKNKPSFLEEDMYRTDSFEQCSIERYDGFAYANVCNELKPNEDEQSDLTNFLPLDWLSEEYKDYLDGSYLFNLVSAIDNRFTKNTNIRNKIIITNYMFYDGKKPFDDAVYDYITETGNHVLYRVTPDIEYGCLIPKGILLEAYSVEDEGKGIQFCVYCYNVQPGIEINYETGENKLIEDYNGEYAKETYRTTNKIKKYIIKENDEQ